MTTVKGSKSHRIDLLELCDDSPFSPSTEVCRGLTGQDTCGQRPAVFASMDATSDIHISAPVGLGVSVKLLVLT